MSKLPFRELAEAEIGTFDDEWKRVATDRGPFRGSGAEADGAVGGCGSWIEYAADAAAGAGLSGWRWQRTD